MRTFHTGGVAGGSDITQGLPRVEEIFENRTPKKKAIISDVDGKVKIQSEQRTIKDEEGKDMIVTNARVKILKNILQRRSDGKISPRTGRRRR